ncbi:MAG TPA: AGE family epimerase/isomerase, partial [Clostridia bacterium]|nr:AGE family epimerase/isomerase [Clostridia bacterium]
TMKIPATLWVCAVLLAATASEAADRTAQAGLIKKQLVEQIMPYWQDTAVDREHGGFVLADDGTGQPGRATEKQLVTQARMIWGFSHAHRKGLGEGKRDYLADAAQGYRFLLAHFRDTTHGGFIWSTDLAGKPLNRSKIIYGQSFVLYGLVEYYRASGDKAALQQALDLYRVLQERSHDARRGGWIEHFQADWTPMLAPGPEAIVEVGGYKSANTHLHLMEALAELYEVSGDAAVRKSLKEALDINMKYFYPRNPGRSCFHRQLDWSEVKDPGSQGLSYGHNVEFAWLMVRAQQVLKRKPAWPHFRAHIDHALKYGYDHAKGGVYNRGIQDRPATNRDKIWWVQSEMLAALTDALAQEQNGSYAAALDSLLGWIQQYQADAKDGIWLDTLEADGTPKTRAKAHNWKANYHDVRALVKFVEAFSGS